jgi:LAS superfamily LD-carboxypeptidase LdcB
VFPKNDVPPDFATFARQNRHLVKNIVFFYLIILFGCQSKAENVGSAAGSSANMPAPAPVSESAKPVPATTVSTQKISVSTDYLLGKFEPAKHADFVTVGKPYSDKPGMTLRKEAFEAFKKMFEAAEKEGFTLKIISSTRNFFRQKEIWEGKWTRFAKDAPAAKNRALKILEYSSMPGSSRHHWGTDIDINELENHHFEKGGKHEKTYQWLSEHAHEYGFCQPYTAGRPAGYFEEKWHWSYTPLSKPFLEQFEKNIKDADIKGFKGSETATEIGIVKNYVLGINAACK